MLACANDPTFLTTAIAVMILLLVPMFLPLLRKYSINTGKISSLGSGLAIAAVFAFFLPDLISKIPHVAAHTKYPFLQSVNHLNFCIFVVFLLAFCVMYTLEKVAVERTKNHQEPSKFLFLVHMAVVCAMLMLLVSSFPAMAQTSNYIIGIVCSLAAYEILLEEISLTKHFNSIYSNEGRLIITTAIVIGWIIGIRFFGYETTLFTLLVQAFVIGVVLTAVMKSEFDLINQENNYKIFLVAVFFKTLIIFGITLISDANQKHAVDETTHTAVLADSANIDDTVIDSQQVAPENVQDVHTDINAPAPVENAITTVPQTQQASLSPNT